MTSKLKKHFPMIRDREELLSIIHNNKKLKKTFYSWKEEQQKEFLDFCSGVRGVKPLYDSFFKEVMNPEYAPERLERLLSILLNRKVKIRQILANDSTRIAEESSLLITDIIVELEDGAIANVEVQKVGYHFPGQRSACYSADMLLRQYKRVRNQQKDKFSYYQIKSVFLIVFYESSPKELKLFPQKYIHRSKQVFDSGLQLELLQEYVMISLDIFHANMQNKSIETMLEAWLTFLACDHPERIIELITRYPEFKPLYETLYQMCQNVEGVMGFFSEELRIMDQNLVQYMIEEQQKEIEENEKIIKELREEQEDIRSAVEKAEKERAKVKKEIEEAKKETEEAKKETEEAKKETEEAKKETEEAKKETEESKKKLKEKDVQIEKLMKELEKYRK